MIFFPLGLYKVIEIFVIQHTTSHASIATNVHEGIGSHDELALDVYVYGSSLAVRSEVKVAIAQLLQVFNGLDVQSLLWR